MSYPCLGAPARHFSRAYPAYLAYPAYPVPTLRARGGAPPLAPAAIARPAGPRPPRPPWRTDGTRRGPGGPGRARQAGVGAGMTGSREGDELPDAEPAAPEFSSLTDDVVLIVARFLGRAAPLLACTCRRFRELSWRHAFRLGAPALACLVLFQCILLSCFLSSLCCCLALSSK